ncbi:MAG: DUF1995 family protein [Spirulina sp. SIO3F2]|nr:DUF1995 family protein [Spirulina sp. SIO3F2]
MVEIPKSLDEAIVQSKTATQTALEAGCQRLTIDLVFPEIALQAQAIAWQYAQMLLPDYGMGLKVLFADTGAASLARRDWGEIEFTVNDLGSRFTPVETKVSETDEIFLVVCPSSVEVESVEKLCNIAEGRPVILLIPQLESVATVGIGYAARQLRDRFLSTLETAYYLKPFEGGVVWRIFPSLWQVWVEQENDEGYKLLAEEPQRPAGERLERILLGEAQATENPNLPTAKPGLLGGLQRLFDALSQ